MLDSQSDYVSINPTVSCTSRCFPISLSITRIIMFSAMSRWKNLKHVLHKSTRINIFSFAPPQHGHLAVVFVEI